MFRLMTASAVYFFLTSQTASAESCPAEASYEVCYQMQSSLQKAESTILSDYVRHLNVRLKKIAVSINPVITDCGVETLRKAETVAECRWLRSSRDAALSRLDRLDAWSKSIQNMPATVENLRMNSSPLCPSSSEFSQLGEIRSFNKELYKQWTTCRAMDQ